MIGIVLGSWLMAAAWAAEPVVAVEDDGTVVGRLMLSAAAADDVRRVLSDVHAMADLSPDVLSVEATPKGACQDVQRSTRGLIRPFRLRALRCPTASGWEESLVEPGDFTAYATEWSVRSSPEGTEVVYRVRMQLRMKAPEALLRRSVVQSTRDQLVGLAKRVSP